ncbi:hypothetical protein ES703_75826 [subsurface metagenome]
MATILEETQTQCYVWALIPNHFHLLPRTGPTPLSKVMRRLMTGYAVTFNRRHRRAGHLFQNRYKSVVCEEDPYLLELIRYIHLNPLRAGLVKDPKELDKYPWSGHSTILGHRQNPLLPKELDKPNKLSQRNKLSQPDKPNKPEKPLAEKTIEDVLLHFGDKLNEARRRYRQFVKNGVDRGSRPELQGGGLIRSSGGNRAGLLGRKKEDRELGDERILGSGDFVAIVLEDADDIAERKSKNRIKLSELISRVCQELKLVEDEIYSCSRKRIVSHARCIISFLAIREMGYKTTEVARTLKVGQPNISRAVEKGRRLISEENKIRENVLYKA